MNENGIHKEEGTFYGGLAKQKKNQVNGTPKTKTSSTSHFQFSLDSPPKNNTLNNESVQMLKNFDENFWFGPKFGITRMERWNRAKLLNRNPPTEVRQIIENNPLENDTYL